MLQTAKKRWFCVLVAAALTACAGQPSSGSEQVGTLEIPLVSTGSGGTQFALAGQFDLVGPEMISKTVLSTDPDFTTADVVTMTPRVGSYDLTLSGWKIYALTGNPVMPNVVSGAQLLSAATVPVSIVGDQTTNVVYRFAVPGSGTVVFATSPLNIDFTVAEGLPDGAACTMGSDCQSKVCDANQTCSPASCTDGVQNGMETSADCGGGCSTCTGDTGGGGAGTPGGSLLLSEIELAPNGGEFIEIVNPTTQLVTLDGYYLSDSGSYWKLPAGTQTLDSSDFIARFPAAASIPAKGVVTVSLDTAANFAAATGAQPTWSVADATMTVVAVNGSANLTNTGELIALFYWDGQTDIVTDVDLLLAGVPTTANGLVSKSGVAIDGPDPGTTPTTYLTDANTLTAQASAPGPATSTKRIALEAGHETHAGSGNGIDGDDETSEQTSSTWDSTFTPPTPGVVPAALLQ